VHHHGRFVGVGKAMEVKRLARLLEAEARMLDAPVG